MVPRRRFASALLGALLVFGPPGAAGSRISDLVPSTVCIHGEVPSGQLEASGFVVGDGRTIITTAHGLERANRLRVHLSDGRVFPAAISRLGNERIDLAVLRLQGPALEPLPLGSVSDLSLGDPVHAIGCPSGFGFSVTQGIVSSVRESDLGYPMIQTDVPINPGSSGGPLVASSGRVVGVIKGSVEGANRIHFALPADLAAAALADTRRENEAYRLFNEAVAVRSARRKVELYEQVLGLTPNLPEVHHNVALAYEDLGEPESALGHYRRSLEVAPANPAASLNLGRLLYQRGAWDEAIAVYEAALRHTPGSIALRNNLAEARRAGGDVDGARQAFEAILRDAPGYAPAHYGLGLVHEADPARAAAAIEHFRKYLELAPQAPDAATVRGWLERLEGRGS